VGSEERTNPRFLAPFFGRTPALPGDARRTLLLVSLGLFFENYDISLVNAALPQIAESLGIAAEDTGYYLSLIRLGGVGAFLLIPFADRVGRRRTFLLCLAGMSLGTFATALSQTPLQFAVCQMVSRAFLMTAAALAVVMLVEELPAELRGGGIGLLGILGGIGFGFGAALYAAVDLLPFGWRSMYAFGVVPVLLLPFFRRTLRETRRFEAGQQPALRGPGWLAPLVELARTHPRRAAAIGLAGAFSAMAGIGFFQYTSWFVRTVHGWEPGHYSLLVVGGGLIGVLGNVVGGRGSDRFGRRRIGFGGLLLLPLFVALFALGPSQTLVVAWGLVVLCSSAAGIVLRALATELFPTSHRATAGGWLVLVETVGWSLGLLLVGVFADSAEDLPGLVALFALASLPAAAFLLLVPETHRRELEEIQ
jgi:AAHS family benzoate transporter-like MFS transporter